MTKFRKGDIVSIKGVVESCNDDRVNIIIENHYGYMNRAFGLNDDVTLKSRSELKVGDIVKTANGIKVVIRAIHDKHAWCEDAYDDRLGFYGTHLLTSLTYLA